MRAVDKYLAKAIEFITVNKNRFSKPGSDEIQKVYKGYIASFGSIVKQSGLLPAVVLYSRGSEDGENRRSEASKRPITEAIFELLRAETNLVENGQETLLDFAKVNKNSRIARRETIHAAIALKLAIRTFKIEK